MTMLPTGQHRWESSYRADDVGRPLGPVHHRLVLLDVTRAPEPEDVAALDATLMSWEANYTGPDGVLSCLGWSPQWFEQFTDARSPVLRAVAMSDWEQITVDDAHACLHVASNHEEPVNAAVRSIFELADGDTALSVREVRSGFVGSGEPAARLPGAGIPQRSPLMMGFHSGLRGNQASEDEITIQDGLFAGGTTMHVSRIDLDLNAWYRRSADERAASMYAPSVTADAADALVEDAKIDADQLPESVREHGVVGHAQAAGRARLFGRARINRRDFATADDGRPGTHFVSLQRSMEDFLATRAVMNAADATQHHSAVGRRTRNGINSFMQVRSRGTYVLPPRDKRAFPYARTGF
jgi:hypothetical protein